MHDLTQHGKTAESISAVMDEVGGVFVAGGRGMCPVGDGSELESTERQGK